MADLLTDRRIEELPYTNCGIDMFGPFIIKEGREELIRNGVIFTCFSSRTVHIERTCDLGTDSFIQALRRFVARRGKIRVLRSDNGSNFVRSQKELEKAYIEMDHQKIQFFLQNLSVDCINWHSDSQYRVIWGVFGKDKFGRHAQYWCLYYTHMDDL